MIACEGFASQRRKQRPGKRGRKEGAGRGEEDRGEEKVKMTRGNGSLNAHMGLMIVVGTREEGRKGFATKAPAVK